jgi:hypothetical protein
MTIAVFLARRWVAAGRLDPISATVVATLDSALGEQIGWAVRGLDPSAEWDDAVQTLALAQLEAEACGEAPAMQRARPALRRLSRRRSERVAWVPLEPSHTAYLGDDAEQLGEILAWEALVQAVGRADGHLLWLVIVDGWPLSELGRRLGVSKQIVWRRVRAALERAGPAA